jgi:hypothetical protein
MAVDTTVGGAAMKGKIVAVVIVLVNVILVCRVVGYRPLASPLEKLEPHITVYLTLGEFERLAAREGIRYTGPTECNPGCDCVSVPLDPTAGVRSLELIFVRGSSVRKAYIRDGSGGIERHLIVSDPR